MRTANAGVLLRLDGASILLDGVCREVDPYPATPLWIKEQLLSQLPDAVCFTHLHKDHFDRDFARTYTDRTGRAILGPEGVGTADHCQVGSVQILGVPTRHIGAAGAATKHMSFVLTGSKCIWFLGDASPLQWKGNVELPKPDVVMAPYAYFTTQKGWSCLRSFGAAANVLLHMPTRENDTLGLWPAIDSVVGASSGSTPIHLDVGQRVTL